MRTIEGWTLVEELARGGFGTVWRATGPAGQPAALKLLDPLEAAASPGRFLREVQALRAVRHPGVVRILGAGVHQGQPWLAMELIEGESLAARLERTGRIPTLEAVAIAVEIAGALEAVHAVGLLHRDLKPANVLIEARTERIVLVDFGLALALEPGAPRLTLTGEVLGTPEFMAPEQMRGEPELRPAVDVYGLGATLHALLTGAPPFGTGRAADVMARVLSAEPTPPSRLARGIPSELDALVQRCLARDPALRPTPSAVRQTLIRAVAAGSRRGRAGRALLLLLPALVLGALLMLGPGSTSASPPEVEAAAPLAATWTASQGTACICVIQPGPFDGQDTFVQSVGLYANDNYGASPRLRVGDRTQGQTGDARSFIRFDLSELPRTAEVHSARLELTVASDLGEGQELLLRVHRVGARWIEGTCTNDAELDGIAWHGDLPGDQGIARDAGRPDLDQPPVLQDSEPGACLVQQVIRPGQKVVALDLTRAVQDWLREPARNHGVRLMHAHEETVTSQGALEFHSSDALEVSRRPQLVVEYAGQEPRDLAWERQRAETLGRETARQLLSAEQPTTADLIEACRLAPGWARPFLVRARARATMPDVEGGPDPGSALELLRLALARPVEPEDRPLFKEVLVGMPFSLSQGLRLRRITDDQYQSFRSSVVRLLEELPDPELRASEDMRMLHLTLGGAPARER